MENKGEMHLVKKKRTLTEQADMPTPPPCLQSANSHGQAGAWLRQRFCWKGAWTAAPQQARHLHAGIKTFGFKHPEGRCGPQGVVGSRGWREGGRDCSLFLLPTPDRQPYPSVGPAVPHSGEHLDCRHSSEEILPHLGGGREGMEGEIQVASCYSSSGV